MLLGPGSWRFNPYLLENLEFQALLDTAVALFLASDYYGENVALAGVSGAGISGADGSGSGVSGAGAQGLGIRSVQEKWEPLKAIIKYCAQQFTKGQKARYKARFSRLQREREQLLDDKKESARIKKLEEIIEQKS
ncbi:uncharacterized protein ATC70_010868 [Mucor velutinosus]|uniref:Uncharacterized protein n=1 Tax=Mucor velutinosus TaxID=708070 RepID=A0AAN7DJT7_9FUNG|nr:hypothetical protein ATC70_010868 [Mucor velutinosus]